MMSVILLITVLFIGASQQPQVQLSSQPQDVTIAALTSKPDVFDQRVVRANIQLVLTYHIAVACPLDSDKNCVLLELDCDDEDSCGPMRHTIDSNIKGTPLEEMRGSFTVIGKFTYVKKPRGNDSPFILKITKIEVLRKSSSRQVLPNKSLHASRTSELLIESLRVSQLRAAA